VSAASYLETSIVLDKHRDPVLSAKLDGLMELAKMVIEPVTAEQAKIARQAYRDYGRGSGHPANLNFGDCFSYALARDKREPILYKGDDFVHTDLRSA
jgi:ribonuclease VapC